MKKSDLVKDVVEFVKYYDGGYLEPYVADKLLAFLVDKGMLPPEYTKRTFAIPEVSSGYERLNEWESEDD